MVKRAKTLFKSDRELLCQIPQFLGTQFSWKSSLLVICKILELFLNTLTAGDKYSLQNRANLLQHFQMQLSQKRKNFSNFLILNLEIEIPF